MSGTGSPSAMQVKITLSNTLTASGDSSDVIEGNTENCN